MPDIVTQNGFSIHYEPSDKGCFSMDASVENECAQVFIRSANYISKSLHIRIGIQTTSLGEGSVIRYFQLSQNSSSFALPLLSAITFLIQQCLFMKKEVSYDQLVEAIGDVNGELDTLLKKHGIGEDNIKHFSLDNYLSGQRNIFYSSVLKDKSIKRVDFSRGQNYAKDNKKTVSIERGEFNEFIEKVEPEEESIENAKIYIVAPILIKSNKNWMGLYNGEPITFKVLSKEFKLKSQNGEYQFSTGSNIIGTLRYKIVYDDEGEPHRRDYELTFVSEIGKDNNYKMTTEGKQKQINDAQPSLFDGID